MSPENRMRRHRPSQKLTSSKEAETKVSQKQISIRLDPDLHRKFAIVSRTRGETMTEIITEAIVNYVEKYEPKQK